ncbi:MAG TPA: EAL domain-containing protein [Noviherbaspirillum sp.]|uniref:bifunctional diguanylate cyclase/phosphodiesterase n=1 Tax=Noviherbaspirillum sp. TaxID=1926288 RepID=UPI002F933262
METQRRWPARLKQFLSRYRHFSPALLWPVAGILLWIALEAFMAARLRDEKAEALEAATQQASARSRSYAAQLLRTVQQIDQLTLNLKLDWEQSGARLDLQQQQEQGLYPRTALLYATIVSRDGESLSSTVPTSREANFSNTDFFQYHRRHNSGGMVINRPTEGLRLGRPVVRFSRRLDAGPDFDGVALVSVEPAYLTTFHDERNLSPGDFISVQLPDGTLIANTEVGTGRVRSYREGPSFAPAEGATLEPATKFHDGEARIVAWMKLREYPLVSMAAIAEHNALAPYRRVADSYRNIMRLAGLGIVAFTLTGMAVSARLSWRRQREEGARRAFRIATDAAQEGFYTTRPIYGRDGRIVDFLFEDCNEHGAALFGMDVANVRGKRLSDLLHPDYRHEILDLYVQTMETGFYEDEFRVPHISPLRATWVNRRYVRSGDGVAVTLRDISRTKEHELALSQMANTDALTRLPNRHWLGGFMPEAVERAQRQHRRLAVMFIDLDNFKNVNDSLGHEAGDELLREAAARLKSVVRAADHVVRLGGDEFTVILENPSSGEDVARIARQIVRTIGDPFLLIDAPGKQHVSASIGIAMFPEDGDDDETLLRHADIAMYAAKAAGKGRFQLYQPQLSDSLFLKLAKEHALRDAIAKDQFVIHYQPRVSARAGRLASLEALVRWQHPERGLVYPDCFIGLAEDTGMIVRLGELVIDKVCAQLAEWRRRGVGRVPVSVNVSGLQLKEGGVSACIAAALARHQVAPELLEVELTESSVIDRGSVGRELAALRTLGVKLSVDDFGTGYSSLAQLQQLDVDVLKVDKAFTNALGKSDEGAVLFKAIVSMADALDISVVAEGVETAEQLQTLQSLDCDEVQGYLVSEALPPQDVPPLVRRQFLFPAPSHAWRKH